MPNSNGSAAGPSRSGGTVGERFDVIIVGARCAGASLAVILARAGMKVAVIEQATFPKMTLSSHLMEADGLDFLRRIGALDAVRQTGARFMKQIDMRLNDLRVVRNWPLRFDDAGGAMFLRRHLLDSILAEAATAAGADVRMGTKVVEVIWERQRASGVLVQHEGAENRLYAPLIVGADGRNSTIAYMCGSRKYNVTPNHRSYYFTFFEGASPAADDTVVLHRWGDRMVWAGPADNGLYLCGVSPEVHEREYFRSNTEKGLLAHMRSCDPTADALANARIATPIAGIRNFEGYFRQAYGPGWVLLGDSGHFKDPSAGRGIGDAFIQAEALAPAIIAGLGGPGPGLGPLLQQWAQWRDRKFEGHYWLAGQLGWAGTFPTMLPEVVRGLEEQGKLDDFLNLFSHRTKYYEVFPVRDVALATARVLRDGTSKRGTVLKETATLLSREIRRRRLNHNPKLAPTDLTAAPAARLRAAAGGSVPAAGTAAGTVGGNAGGSAPAAGGLVAARAEGSAG
jgi:2-polyprenyl-6-methoxyphenol hydroxylase-like FAD-dependent oxidoreductase